MSVWVVRNLGGQDEHGDGSECGEVRVSELVPFVGVVTQPCADTAGLGRNDSSAKTLPA